MHYVHGMCGRLPTWFPKSQIPVKVSAPLGDHRTGALKINTLHHDYSTGLHVQVLHDPADATKEEVEKWDEKSGSILSMHLSNVFS